MLEHGLRIDHLIERGTLSDFLGKDLEQSEILFDFSTSGGSYRPDDNGAPLSEAVLRAKADPLGDAQTLTYTAVPPGSGERMGIDRDEDTLGNGVETNTGTFIDANDTGTNPALADTDGDGFDDGVEVAAGSDPNDSGSTPVTPVPLLAPLPTLILAGILLFAMRQALGRVRAYSSSST